MSLNRLWSLFGELIFPFSIEEENGEAGAAIVSLGVVITALILHKYISIEIKRFTNLIGMVITSMFILIFIDIFPLLILNY